MKSFPMTRSLFKLSLELHRYIRSHFNKELDFELSDIWNLLIWWLVVIKINFYLILYYYMKDDPRGRVAKRTEEVHVTLWTCQKNDWSFFLTIPLKSFPTRYYYYYYDDDDAIQIDYFKGLPRISNMMMMYTGTWLPLLNSEYYIS